MYDPARAKEWKELRVFSQANGLRRCASCNSILPLAEFGVDQQTNDGRRTYCRKCNSFRALEYAERRKAQDPEGWRAIRRVRHIKSKYGLTPEAYAALGSNCHICNRELDKPIVDHDHTTGSARGVLCNSCNTGIGQFGDDIAMLAKAIAYLAKYECDDYGDCVHP